MFTVLVSDHVGPAEFELHSPVAALQLVLLADRACMPWSATAAPDGGTPTTLTLQALRDLAAHSARVEPSAAAHLRQVGADEQRAAVAMLN